MAIDADTLFAKIQIKSGKDLVRTQTFDESSLDYGDLQCVVHGFGVLHCTVTIMEYAGTLQAAIEM